MSVHEEEWMSELEQAIVCLKFSLMLKKDKNDKNEDPTGSNEPPPIPSIEYKGNVIDLVELGLAIWNTQQFYVNGKPVTQEMVAAAIEKLFGVSMDNFHGKVQDLKKRKTNPAAKMVAMTNALLDYLGRLADDRARRK